MGMYDPIWRRLKESGTVRLSIPVGLQDRVIKGVIRTKDEDLLYKLEMDEKKRWTKLSYVTSASLVIFTLHIHIKTKDLSLEDL